MSLSALDQEIERIQQELAQEEGMRDMLDDSIKEMRSTVNNLRNQIESASQENIDNEWKVI